MLAILTVLAASAADSSVDSVVVFPDRASVTRVMTTTLTPGRNRIEFSDLPPTFDERTLQVGAAGVVGARILGLDVVTRELAEDRRIRVADLEARIEVLKDAIVADDDSRAAAQVELDFLRQLQVAATSQASAELLFGPNTLPQTKGIADLLQSRVPEAQAKIRAAEIAARHKREELSALERELGSTRGSSQWSERHVAVEIESPGDGTATVRLSYVLPGASWSPVYDARALPDEGKLELSFNAIITQVTGEDWTDASLSLSTARPSEGVAPPEIHPFWLERRYDVATSGYSAGAFAEQAPASTDTDMFMAPADMPALETVAAVVTERMVATSFEVGGRTTVKGDGTRRKVHVSDHSLPVTFTHVTAPRFEEAAFLVAEGTWHESWPLLGGEVSSFVDDAFIGSSAIETVGTGGELALPFGRDDAVEVRSVQTEAMTSRPNLFGRVKVSRSWTFSVKNGRSTGIHVEVRERIPVATHARFVVLYRGDEPTEALPDGILTFDRDVAPDQSGAVAFGYEIRHPRRMPPAVLE